MKRKTIWKKTGIYTMTAASGYVQGTVKRAPSSANLEENGMLRLMRSLKKCIRLCMM